MLAMLPLILKPLNPMKASMALIGTSLWVATMVYSQTLSVFCSASLVISYSSGIIILFSYASLITNQESKKKSRLMPLRLILLLLLDTSNINHPRKTRLDLSIIRNSILLVIIIIVVIVTIKAINSTVLKKSISVSHSF